MLFAYRFAQYSQTDLYCSCLIQFYPWCTPDTLKIGLSQSKTQEEVPRQRHRKRSVPAAPPDYICATIMLINMGVGGRARSVRCGFSQTNFKCRPEWSGRVFQSSKSCVNSSAKVMSFGKFPARIWLNKESAEHAYLYTEHVSPPSPPPASHSHIPPANKVVRSALTVPLRHGSDWKIPTKMWCSW